MTYTLQELEGLVEIRTAPEVKCGKCDVCLDDPRSTLCRTQSKRFDATIQLAAVVPELIATIRELDPSFHAKPSENSVARATELMRDAADRRSKLEDALAKAKLGNPDELRALGLEAYFEEDGTVKIRQKKRDSGNVDP